MGEYFILDRQSGGRLGWLWSIGKSDWFALYKNDGQIDDATWCNGVERGRFRLHPKGPRGVSQGCIVIERANDFKEISRILRAEKPEPIPNTNLSAWGKVVVR